MWVLISGQTESLFGHTIYYNTNYYGTSSLCRRISIPSPMNGREYFVLAFPPFPLLPPEPNGKLYPPFPVVFMDASHPGCCSNTHSNRTPKNDIIFDSHPYFCFHVFRETRPNHWDLSVKPQSIRVVPSPLYFGPLFFYCPDLSNLRCYWKLWNIESRVLL